MEFLLEYSSYYKVGDKVLIEYWYNDDITVVKIDEIIGRKYKVTHNIPESKIFNAPDELLKSSDIIDYFKP
jgi:hypothetical protein